MPLQLGTCVWAGYEPLYLARQNGWIKPKDIRLVEMPNSTDTMRALRAGLIQGAALTLDETLTLLQDGLDLRIVLVLDVSKGGDAILARPGIDTLSDLRGKRVGVESSAVGAYVLSRAMDFGGIASKEVKIVNLSVDTHEEAYDKGKVDALVTFEPIRTKLLDRGAKVIFDSRQMPREIFDVLVVTQKILKERPEIIEKLRRAWFEALDFLKSRPSEALSIMAPREGLDPLAFQRALAGLEFPDRVLESRLRSGDMLKSTEKLVELMLKKRLLVKPVNGASLFLNS